MSYNTTILLHSNSVELKKYLHEICNEKKLVIANIKQEEDILAVPAFILFIDAKKINQKNHNYLNVISEDSDYSFFQIVVLGFYQNERFKLSGKNISNVEIILSKRQIEKLIKESQKTNERMSKKETLLKNKIYRIIHLHNFIKENKKINIDELCITYDISKRTLRRDLKIIKDLYPDLDFITQGNWNENTDQTL